MEKEIENPNSSAFNEAVMKMARLNKIQDKCNDLRENHYASCKNGKFGFQNHYFSLDSLYLEISAKVTNKEKEKIKPMLKELREIVMELRKHFKTGTYGYENKYTYSKEAEKIKDKLYDKLYDVEEELRLLMDVHGFSTLTAEDELGDGY